MPEEGVMSVNTMNVSSETQTLQFTTPVHERVRYSFYSKAGTAEENWAMSQFGEESLAGTFKERLGRRLSGMNVRLAWSLILNPMNARVLCREDFSRSIALPCVVELRIPEQAGEGIRLERHEALVLGTGGCGVLALSYINEDGRPGLLAAHAGRDSLVDKAYIQDGTPSRPYFSIIGALAAYAEQQGGKREEMILRSFGTVPWQDFPHSTEDPVHGTYNELLLGRLEWRYGDSPIKIGPGDCEYLCLSSLIEAQALEERIVLKHDHNRELPAGYALHPEPWRNFSAIVCE